MATMSPASPASPRHLTVTNPSSPTSDSSSIPAVPELPPSSSNLNADPHNQQSSQQNQQRRSSFNFLRRQKSGETAGRARSGSSGKMSKKQKAQMEEQLRLLRAQVPRQPPRLPSHNPLPQMNTFGGDSTKHPHNSYALVSGRQNDNMNAAAPYGVPVPPLPGNFSSMAGYNSSFNGDPYSPTESMTNRGRYSYASSAVSTLNSPRRVRRRKDPTPFNILVIGARNAGKTSFIKFLRTSLQLPAKKRPGTPSSSGPVNLPGSSFSSQYLDTEIDGERIGLTLWDSQGLERNVVDLQIREMSAFLESKFEDTFTEEQKVFRAPGVRDTHIHCVFLILEPARLDANLADSKKNSPRTKKNNNSRQQFVGVLDDELDLQVLRALQGKTAVIPVISKSDSVTTAHMAQLKKAVWESLQKAKLDPLESFSLDDSESEPDDRLEERDEDKYMSSQRNVDGRDSPTLNHNIGSRSSSDEAEGDASDDSSDSTPASEKASKSKHRRKVSSMSAAAAASAGDDMQTPILPLSILSPDTYEPGVIGRRFPWGFADPYNAQHCDFVRLKESVFSEWRSELREASRERWYEGWRTSRLNRQLHPPKPRSMPPPSQAPPPMPRTGYGKSGNPAARNMSNGRAVSAGNSPHRNRIVVSQY